MQAIRRQFAWAGVFLAVGLLLLTRPAWTGVQEQLTQRVMAAERSSGAYAQLRIPAIGLDALVVDGATLRDYQQQLEKGPAHLAGSAAPGAVGNAVIFGHRDEYGSPFGRLYQLRAGETISVQAGLRTYTYRVVSLQAVSPSDLAVLAPPARGGRELTLITCTGPGNTERLVVRAAA